MKKLNFLNLNRIFFTIIIFILFVGCQRQSEYTKVLTRELEKKNEFNDLIFDMKIGQSRQDYFDICYQLNKQKKIISGERSLNPELILKSKNSSVKGSNIKMSFNGIFNEKKIMRGFEMRFYFTGWSNWNKDLSSENLLDQLKDSLNGWFPGNNFFKVNFENNLSAEVKIDGNRRILAYKVNSKDVAVRIEDMSGKYD
ncbi:MAG: hypothetical protein CMC48_07150 [Flavobacteriaceae bacterium]|nr:hypothetical protein [Flavobacteriaceae bacterium]|tara:strand:- start:3340 stop:3933 length:594 start_codon:yes stop_codon:yes gene_type:complete